MTELPPNYGQPEQQKTPRLAKVDIKFVQALGKYGIRIDQPKARAYFFPVAVVKPVGLPVGVYQLVEFKDLPDEMLASFGLQKIPANG